MTVIVSSPVSKGGYTTFSQQFSRIAYASVMLVVCAYPDILARTFLCVPICLSATITAAYTHIGLSNQESISFHGLRCFPVSVCSLRQLLEADCIETSYRPYSNLLCNLSPFSLRLILCQFFCLVLVSKESFKHLSEREYIMLGHRLY